LNCVLAKILPLKRNIAETDHEPTKVKPISLFSVSHFFCIQRKSSVHNSVKGHIIEAAPIFLVVTVVVNHVRVSLQIPFIADSSDHGDQGETEVEAKKQQEESMTGKQALHVLVQSKEWV
jgi:hypothetical protein